MNEDKSPSESDSKQTRHMDQEGSPPWGEGPPPKWLFRYWMKNKEMGNSDHVDGEEAQRRRWWFGDWMKKHEGQELDNTDFKDRKAGVDKRKFWMDHFRNCKHTDTDKTMHTGDGPDSDSFDPSGRQHCDSDQFKGISKDHAWRKKMFGQYKGCPYFSKYERQRSPQEHIFDEFSMENGN